jgi:outer membrane receptor for ferrienterochelin and colicins
MSRNPLVRLLRRATLLAALTAVLPASALAQTGRITGTVTNQQSAPVYGAQVSVVGTRIGALTNASGQFVLPSVPAGAQQLRISFTGYGEFVADVTVQPGQATHLAVQLQGQAIELGAIVVSAARQAQRITDAPATITRIDANVIDNSVGNTWAGALKQVKGLDFIQVGVTSVAINARGFNSSFNNRMLMMEDGRISVLPENGLPVGAFTPTPKVDLAWMEVLVGPGAALYGADASNGVISLQSKDPRQYPGTTAEITAGNRSYRDVQARQAGVIGNLGYKVAGEWQVADDWSNRLTLLPGSRTKEYAPGDERVAGWQPEVGPGGQEGLDWRASVIRGTGALVYYGANDGRLEVSAGASQTDGVGQTNVGRNQLDDWRYNFLQAKFSNANWFLNAYRAQSQSGTSYANNRFTGAWYTNQTRPASQRLSDQELILASDWPSDGRMYAGEVQYNNRVAPLANTHFTVGAQVRQDQVSSDRQWLTDRLTGEDVSIRQLGVYGQSTTPLAAWADVVLAARVDDHQNYERQFSPKAGVVLKPLADQAFRVTYNQAFKSPTILQTNFHIPDWTPIISIFGNTEGYVIRDASGTEVRRYDALVPERNRTWEFGYKGLIRDRLFVDVAHYRSEYENFISPLAIVSDPFGLGLAGQPAGVRTFAYDAQGNLMRNAAGAAPIMLLYYNLGRAKLTGTDAEANVLVAPRVSLKGTVSLVDLQSFDVERGREESTALNSPELKWTLGANVTDVANVSGGATVRHVQEYYFRSGLNKGVIPGFTTLDMSLGYDLPRLNTRLNVGVSNLFTCGGTFTYDYNPANDPHLQNPTAETRECGFGVKHQEMIGMPAIGTMLFVGVRYHVQ